MIGTYTKLSSSTSNIKIVSVIIKHFFSETDPESTAHGVDMGPTWADGDPTNLVIWAQSYEKSDPKDQQLGPRLNIKTVFRRYGIPMLKIRGSQDCLLFNMGITKLVRHLYIEIAPRSWLFLKIGPSEVLNDHISNFYLYFSTIYWLSRISIFWITKTLYKCLALFCPPLDNIYGIYMGFFFIAFNEIIIYLQQTKETKHDL